MKKGKSQFYKKMINGTDIEESIEKRLKDQNNNKERLFKESMKILLENIEKRITINDLCGLLGTNPNTISKVFNEKINQTPAAWIKKERLEISERLLIKTDCKVYQVAYEVGYSDPNNFSTAFKNHFGESPESYRKSKKAVVN